MGEMQDAGIFQSAEAAPSITAPGPQSQPHHSGPLCQQWSLSRSPNIRYVIFVTITFQAGPGLFLPGPTLWTRWT